MPKQNNVLLYSLIGAVRLALLHLPDDNVQSRSWILEYDGSVAKSVWIDAGCFQQQTSKIPIGIENQPRLLIRIRQDDPFLARGLHLGNERIGPGVGECWEHRQIDGHRQLNNALRVDRFAFFGDRKIVDFEEVQRTDTLDVLDLGIIRMNMGRQNAL